MIRIPTDRVPTHPGEMLQEEFLQPIGLTPRALSEALHVPHAEIEELVAGKRGLTASLALRLAKFFGTSVGFWMNLQLVWDVYHVQQVEARALEDIQPYRTATQ